MKKVIEHASAALRGRGYYAPVQEIKRAYWRQTKRNGGGLDPYLRGNDAADYLIFNRI